MFILFLCAILWNITDCSVTPPANLHAWDDDDWRWWWKTTTTKSPYTFDHDYNYNGGSDYSSTIPIVIIIITLVAVGLVLACQFYCKECTCDDGSTSSSSSTLHPPPRRAVPPPRDRARQTVPDTDPIDTYLRNMFPISTVQVQSSPANTGASSSNNIFRVDLFSYSNDRNVDDNNSVQSGTAGSDKPPGYSEVIRSDPTGSNFPAVKPTVPDSPPPKYDDKKY